MNDTVPPYLPNGLTPQNATVVELALRIPDLWCVYEHYMHVVKDDEATQELIFVGACHMRDVYTFADARRNSEWLKIVGPYTHLYVKITYTGEALPCRQEVFRYVRGMPVQPRCNLIGYNMQGLARPIICSNGQEYANQSEAVRALKINQGALSRHMNGKVRSVGGYTFTYKDVDK